MKGKVKEFLEKSGVDTKQLIVSIIILFVAVIMIINAYPTKQPTLPKKQLQVVTNTVTPKAEEIPDIEEENNILSFTANTEEKFDFQIYYTVSADMSYDDEFSVIYPAEQGTHEYRIVLPLQDIYRIRIDFGTNPGKVNIKNIHLSSAPEADLNNFSEYSFSQLDNIEINEQGLSFTSEGDNPLMEYLHLLKPASEEVTVAEQAPEEATVEVQ